MTRASIAEELESADRIADVSRPDLQIVLRCAALMLRNVAGVALEPATEDALTSIAAELKIGRSDLIARILREWLEPTPTCQHTSSAATARPAGMLGPYAFT